MRTTRVFVHGSLIDLAPFHSLFNELQQLLLCLYVHLCQSFNENACLWVLTNQQASARLCVRVDAAQWRDRPSVVLSAIGRDRGFG